MKTLALTLLTLGMMLGTSATEAAIRVKVGPVRVAAGRRIPHRPFHPVHVAPRPIIHHAHPVAAAANFAGAVVAERRDTVQDIREERLDRFQDLVEEQVDTVRDVREERRQAAWNWLLSNCTSPARNSRSWLPPTGPSAACGGSLHCETAETAGF